MYRILQWRYEINSAGKSDMDVAEVIASRVKTAVETRQMIGLPSEDTTVFRLVNRCPFCPKEGLLLRHHAEFLKCPALD